MMIELTRQIDGIGQNRSMIIINSNVRYSNSTTKRRQVLGKEVQQLLTKVGKYKQ